MKPTLWITILVALVSAPLPCQAQWRWLYPSLRGEFRSCVMASADHAYILTASDSVLETRDQGRTWTTMEVDGLPTFGVFFRPSLGFLVVRDRGAGSNLLLSWHILKTSNGGQSWHRLPPTFGDVVDVYFGTDSLGWVTLRTGAGMHTTDGGQTWEPNAPGTPPIIRWMDRNTWYGYRHYSTEVGRRDSVLWYSFDGGATWKKRTFTAFPRIGTGYTLQSECLSLTHTSTGTFLALNHVYALSPSMQTFFTSFSIARSNDSGRTWSMEYNPVVFQTTGSSQRAEGQHNRAFPYRFLSLGDSVVAVVSDIGRNWLRFVNGAQASITIDILFDEFTNCGYDSDHEGRVIAVSSSRKRIQWSTDVGNTWTWRNDEEMINTSMVRALLSFHSTGLVIGYAPYYVALSKNGYLVFDGVQKIHDSTSSMHIVEDGPCQTLDDHRALLANTGSSTYQMFELTDNKEWFPITSYFNKPTPVQSPLGTSYYLGAGRAVIAAADGVIYAHVEDTWEWKRVDSVIDFAGSEAASQRMRFFSRDEGVCVDYEQGSYRSRTGLDSLVYFLTVRTTSDGGKSWTRIQTPLKQFIQLVQPSLANKSSLGILNRHSYLTGNPDGIRKTTDWGHTWTLVCPATEGIFSISAVDSLRAFATTEHELLGTIDGGQRWSRITPRDASGRVLSAGVFTKVFTTPSGFVLACLPDGFIGGMADSILTGVDRTEPVFPTDPLRIYPNPGVAGGTVRIRFTQQTAGSASITLYSLLGQHLHHEILDDRHVGPREVTLCTAGLPPGLYFVAVSTPEGVRVGKVVVGR